MIDLIIAGVLSFMGGTFFGILLMALLSVNRGEDEYERDNNQRGNRGNQDGDVQ